MKWLIVSIVLSLSLVSIWFMHGRMLAHAEEGVPFYKTFRTFAKYKYFWQDSQLGSFQPFLFSRAPLYRLAGLLESIGLDPVTFQRMLFFVLVLTPLVSVPYLSQRLIPTSDQLVGRVAALIYVFNLFVLSQVLQRFIYPLVFLWSYLPLFLYLWLGWLEKRGVKYLLWLIIASFLFSDMFGLISSVIALWLPAVILWFKSRKFISGVIALLVWVVVNIWWWLPIFSIKNNPYTANLNAQTQLKSLADVSSYYPNREIIFLKQKYYFGPGSAWNNIYNRPYAILISKVLVGLLIIGFLRGLFSYGQKLLIIWLGVAWFLVKGASFPWGIQIYSFLFTNYPFLTALRNPYEKLGVIFLLPYALLISWGLSLIPFRFVKILVIVVVCFVYLRPYWTNQIFASYIVDVPGSYQTANNYLNSQSNLRLLQLPFLLGAGVNYKWGLAGDESSDLLFDRPSLSKTFYEPQDPYLEIYKHIRSPNMYKLLQLFAVDTIVLHHDVNMAAEYQENVPGTEAYLGEWKNIKLSKKLGELDIYELDRRLRPQWGYLSNYLRNQKSMTDGIKMVITDEKFNSLVDAFSVNHEFNLVSGKLPVYEVTKISPVQYKFHINGSQFPYVLILSVNYHPNWMAKINDQMLTDHRIVNGFANGWLVDRPGSYTIDIKFKTWPWE